MAPIRELLDLTIYQLDRFLALDPLQCIRMGHSHCCLHSPFFLSHAQQVCTESKTEATLTLRVLIALGSRSSPLSSFRL